VNPSRKQARYTLVILFAINLLNFYDRHIFGALAEPIRREWSLSDSQIGWLATAFTLLYAVVGVPLGRLSDRWSRARLLSWGVAFWSILTAVSGIAWNYRTLFAARLGVGVGEATCAPAANSLIGDLFPASQRARALAFFMLGLPMGNFLGTYVSGFIAAGYGWRTAFYVAGIPGLALAVLAMWVLDPPRGASENSPSAGRAYEGSPYWTILRIPTLRLIIITGALFNFNMYALATFLPGFIHRYHSLGEKQASAIAALVFGLTGVPGLLLGGWAADRAVAVRAAGRLLLGFGATLIAAACMWLAFSQQPRHMTSFIVLMAMGCMIAYTYYASVYATIQEIVPPSLRGTAMALYFLAMYLLGGSFGPVLTGKLSDYFARNAMAAAGASVMNEQFRAAGLHTAMFAVPFCSAILAVVLVMSARTVAADMKSLQDWMSLPDVQPQAKAGN
jgi:predicted MFS family arabinose efflux permease